MNKVVFITGASGGIGNDLSISFGRAGWRVALGYNNNKDSAEKLKELLVSNGIEAEIFGFNASNFSQAEAIGDKIYDRFGRIDALINNAGIAHYGLMTDSTEDDYRRVFDINVGGTVAVTKGVLPYMLRQKRGSIVNISSVWGITGGANEVLYSASKAAIIGFTKALAKEVAESRIRVNCIAPGVIDTPMLSSLSEKDKKELIEKTPLGRLGTGQDISGTALFLCSLEADFITGQVISPNGGFQI